MKVSPKKLIDKGKTTIDRMGHALIQKHKPKKLKINFGYFWL